MNTITNLLTAFPKALASGYNTGQLFPAGTPNGVISQNGTDLISYIPRVADLLLQVVSIAVVVMLIWSGLRFIWAGDNEEELGRAKKFFLFAIIGFIVVVISWTLVRVVTYVLR